MDFRLGQAAAYVSVDSECYSDLSAYYCTIDWDPIPSGLRSGYHTPFGVVRLVGPLLGPVWPYLFVEGWTGEVDSPRFHYDGSNCSEEISLPQLWIGN